jgi:hypothetical protein
VGQASLLCSVFQTLRAGSLPGISADRTTYLEDPPMVSRAAAFFVRFWGVALRSLCVAWSDGPAGFVRWFKVG